MKADIVQIDEMHLSVPGLSQEAANMLGRDVVRRVSNNLPEKIRSNRLASLGVQVSIPQGTPTEQLAEMIADKICKSLI